MLGQVATLRDRVTDIATLHREVTVEAAGLLEHYRQRVDGARPAPTCTLPADIAVIGIASILPKANTTQDYWENILAKVDAITEIPSHRWDWRLYFDADRDVKDKNLFQVGRLSRRPRVRPDEIRDAAEIDRIGGSHAADGVGGGEAHARRCRLRCQALRPGTRLGDHRRERRNRRRRHAVRAAVRVAAFSAAICLTIWPTACPNGRRIPLPEFCPTWRPDALPIA